MGKAFKELDYCVLTDRQCVESAEINSVQVVCLNT